MKKILLAFDGRHVSKGILEFAKDLNKKSPILATGVFLPIVDYSELLYSLGGLSGPIYVTDITQADDDIIQVNIKEFEVRCQEEGIAYTVHSDITEHVINYLKGESRYGDLLAISGELFYENLGEDTQDEYIEDTLLRSECPVMIVPESYRPPEKVILAYDGSASSVYAIKQFSYLFPEYRDLETLLVYADPKNEDMPDIKVIEELARLHFSKLSLFKLDADPRKYFETWLMDKGNTLLVSGAYGRSAFSEMLKKSFIQDVIKDHRVPIFVAHR
jgi:nucleotide-binding universal stress UspA family protein